MKNKKLKRLAAILPLALLAVVSTGRLEAYELNLGTNWPPVDFHGFVSQGFLYSTAYNYLGDSSRGSFRFTEAGLNASFNPFPRTRIAAQGFTYDVGQAGDYDVVLDYALAEYTFNDYIGVRAGRIRRPEGIYNDIQDVDLARTWVLLPQGMYNARWRDFYVNIDGGEIFGNIPLEKAGSLSYEFYYGFQRPKLDGGLSLQKANLPPYLPLTSINSPQLGGGQLWWNTPLEGLRAGRGAELRPRSDVHRFQWPPERRLAFHAALFAGISLEFVDISGRVFALQNQLSEHRRRPAALHQGRRAGHLVCQRRLSVQQIRRGGRLLHRILRRCERPQRGRHCHFHPMALKKTRRCRCGLIRPTGGYSRSKAITSAARPSCWTTPATRARNDNGWWMLAVKTTFSF